ncbi:MAG: BglII/BstYI family type II restriction endonuclease [Terracidiphilus sp.]
MAWIQHIPVDVQELYEIHDYHHAAAILAVEFPTEFDEILEVLRSFRIRTSDLTKPGGNESNIPKLISSVLRPLGWEESNLHASMVVDGQTIHSDTHKVDYIKKRVAFDLEWNSKDQTFDRDLFAFRSFHDYGRISVGVLLTRSAELNPVFKGLGIPKKYGAATTWMGKLLPRLDAGRGGGCPILVFGITPRLIADLNQE